MAKEILFQSNFSKECFLKLIDKNKNHTTNKDKIAQLKKKTFFSHLKIISVTRPPLNL